jgi:myotubularin-related protein 9
VFSNKTNEHRSLFDVQSQCENLVAGDSMWRISHVNKSYRVYFKINFIKSKIMLKYKKKI